MNNVIFNYHKEIFKPYYFSIISVKGVGYKFYYLKDNNGILIEIGFTHFKFIKIPYGLLMVKKKTKILFFSYSNSILNDFIFQLEKLKKPDVYKGKGIKLFNKNYIVKPGKKR